MQKKKLYSRCLNFDFASEIHSDVDFDLIRRDLVLKTFGDKFSDLNHFIITSRYIYVGTGEKR